MMMSMSGGWFFLVAAEAISVAGQDIKLPGIGSYIAVAIESENGAAIAWAILAMMAGILLYDQLFFRPLLAWADKFRFEESQGDAAQQSWLLDWTRRSRWMMALSNRFWARMRRALAGSACRMTAPRSAPAQGARSALVARLGFAAGRRRCWRPTSWWSSCTGRGLERGAARGGPGRHHARARAAADRAGLAVLGAGGGLDRAAAEVFAESQAVAQFLAAFPVNLLFPLVVFVMVAWKLNPDIWLSPLMVFGTQWYILFNVVAGASTIPNELRLASANLGLKGWLLWRRVYLPAVFPASSPARSPPAALVERQHRVRVCELGRHLADGHRPGSYIKQMTEQGDFHRIALGIGVMCVFVMLLNRFFWRKLYLLAQDQGR